MHHLILFAPIIGLIVFWLLPLSEALPLYLLIVALSAVLYFMLLKALRRPVATGNRGLLGKSVVVVDMHGHEGQVRVNGTTWHAISEDEIENGDEARIVGVEGLTLKIELTARAR